MSHFGVTCVSLWRDFVVTWGLFGNSSDSVLCPLKFEFGKMQKILFGYLQEECFSTIPKMVPYFAAEKMSKT